MLAHDGHRCHLLAAQSRVWRHVTIVAVRLEMIPARMGICKNKQTTPAMRPNGLTSAVTGGKPVNPIRRRVAITLPEGLSYRIICVCERMLPKTCSNYVLLKAQCLVWRDFKYCQTRGTRRCTGGQRAR
jgi:hypothetical protein